MTARSVLVRRQCRKEARAGGRAGAAALRDFEAIASELYNRL